MQFQSISINLKHVRAIFVKDYKEFSRNTKHSNLDLGNIGFTTGDLFKPLLIILAWTVVLTIVSEITIDF